MIVIDLKNLFQSGTIGNIKIKNRIVRSATWESRVTEDGYVTDSLIEFYEEIAKGGTGLIITGYLGPNAFDVFEGSDIEAYKCSEGTVKEAIELYKNKKLEKLEYASPARN